MHEYIRRRARYTTYFLALEVGELGDPFALVGYDAVCDFADDVDEAQVFVGGVLF